MKKKIYFLIESFLVGGAEKVLIDIVNSLNPDKYDITVVSIFKYSVFKNYNEKFEYPFKSYIHFRYLINNHILPVYYLFNYALNHFPSILYRLFFRKHCDIAVAFYEGLPTYWISYARLKDCKKMAWLHTCTEYSQAKKDKKSLLREKYIYKEFDQIIAVSGDVAISFDCLFHLDKYPQVAYNPINSFNVINKSTEYVVQEFVKLPIFVTVGRVVPVKGYKRWLEVVKQLTDKGYQFIVWIVGGGDDKELKAFVAENNLSSVVTFWGHQSNPYPFIKQADWVICTSFYEGLSTVILESIILKKAILTTECPGMRELLGENKFGIIVKNNKEDLLKGVENILKNNSLKEYYEQQVSFHPKNFELSTAINHIELLLDA